MSLERSNIRSSSRHYSPFLCTICTNIPDPQNAVVTTSCSHCFCLPCLESWLLSTSGSALLQCPDCNTNLSFSSNTGTSNNKSNNSHLMNSKSSSMMIGNHLVHVMKLSIAQPLAFRVLNRIKVSCPLKNKHGCQWEGDYGDLQTHLLSTSAHHLNVTDFSTSTCDEMRNHQNFGHENQSRKIHSNAVIDGNDVEDVLSCSSSSTCNSRHDQSPKMKHAKIGPTTHDHNHLNDNTKTIDSNNANKEEGQLNITKTDTTSQQSNTIQKRMELAESFKVEANSKFSMKNYVESRALYQKALSILDNNENIIQYKNFQQQYYNDEYNKFYKLASTLHANVAATYMMTHEYTKCVDSCTAAIQLDKTYIKAYIRKSKALIALGQFDTSTQILKSLIDEQSIGSYQNHITNEMTKQIEIEYNESKQLCQLYQEGEHLLSNQQYINAKAKFGQLLKKSNATNVIVNAARAELGLGLTDSSLRLSLQVLRSDPTCSEGYEVRGVTMHLMGDFDSALQLLKEGLRLNPDCERIKVILKTCRNVCNSVKEARTAIFQRRFQDAIQLITNAIDQQSQYLLPLKAPLYSSLYTERSECYLRLKEYQHALTDASKAVYSLDDYIPAWIIMCNAFHGLGQHEEALSQLQDLMNRLGGNNDQIQRAYEKADFEVRKIKRPDFYKIFGVSPLASEMELKKAYKVKAKELHPDRLASSNYSDEQRREAEKNFKILGEGLEILCDDFKRQLYDEGYDQEAIRERVAAAQQAAHRHQYHHTNH